MRSFHSKLCSSRCDIFVSLSISFFKGRVCSFKCCAQASSRPWRTSDGGDPNLDPSGIFEGVRRGERVRGLPRPRNFPTRRRCSRAGCQGAIRQVSTCIDCNPLLIRQGSGLALPIFKVTKTSAFSTNAQSRFASVVLDGVLGPPHLARHT